MKHSYNDFCLSSYLALRYVADDKQCWAKKCCTELPEIIEGERVDIHSEQDIEYFFENKLHIDDKTGIFLSGGIDSAILASYLPEGSKAYSIDFIAEGVNGESVVAGRYSEELGLDHRVVQITWEDCLNTMDELMLEKKAPLHPVECALYIAAKKARADGLTTILVGNGADSTFGGMDKLLSKDWEFNDFIERYTFLDPQKVLQKPVSMLQFFEKYRQGDRIDVVGFLKDVHGLGIIQSFETAIRFGGLKIAAPYEDLRLAIPLDMERIRNGEPKYMLQNIFHKRFPTLEAPRKIPFARPMGVWLKDWEGPSRPEFKQDMDIKRFTGEQKWLIYCLERFLNLLDKKLS